LTYTGAAIERIVVVDHEDLALEATERRLDDVGELAIDDQRFGLPALEDVRVVSASSRALMVFNTAPSIGTA
jgi:hypothetical protein